MIVNILNEILDSISKPKENKKDDLEQEMDEYDLEDWQKELVRDGINNPWDFDEEDCDEDDDYYKDDEE